MNVREVMLRGKALPVKGDQGKITAHACVQAIGIDRGWHLTMQSITKNTEPPTGSSLPKEATKWIHYHIQVDCRVEFPLCYYIVIVLQWLLFPLSFTIIDWAFVKKKTIQTVKLLHVHLWKCLKWTDEMKSTFVLCVKMFLRSFWWMPFGCFSPTCGGKNSAGFLQIIAPNTCQFICCTFQSRANFIPETLLKAAPEINRGTAAAQSWEKEAGNVETLQDKTSRVNVTVVPRVWNSWSCLSFYDNNYMLWGFVNLVRRNKAPTKLLCSLYVSVSSCFHSPFKESENNNRCR